MLDESCGFSANTCVLSVCDFQELLSKAARTPSAMNPAIPHYVGGIYSQLRPAGWIDELYSQGE